MNKVLTLLFSLVFISSFIFSQKIKDTPPNYKSIEKIISKKKSNLYYPKLFKRYLDADTTMTSEEIRHLYYGYTFRTGYSPYGHSDLMDSLRNILREEEHTQKELTRVITLSDSILLEEPFNLDVMNYQLYAFKKMENKEAFKSKFNQMNLIVDAIFSSGDGISKETAFYVIYTEHEYFVINVIGFQFGGSQSLSGNFDYLELAPNDYNIKGLYFDVSPCLASLKAMFEK